MDAELPTNMDDQAEQILGALHKEQPETATEQPAEATATEVDEALAKAKTNAPDGTTGATETSPTGDQKTAPDEPATPAIEPPKFWKAEHAERWKQLPTELQTYLVEKSEEDARAVNAKFTEAAETRKASEKAKTEYDNALRQVLPAWQKQALDIDNLLNTIVATDPVLARAQDPSYFVNLARTDPARFSQEKAEYDARLLQIQPAIEKRNQLVKSVTDSLTQQRQDFVDAQNQQLLDKMPGWKDDAAKARQQLNEITDYAAKTYGVTAQEVHSLGDHRLVLLLNSDMALRRENAELKQKVAGFETKQAELLKQAEAKKVPPQPAKVAAPGAAQDVEREPSERAKRLRTQALKTGKDSDRIDAVLAALR